jgi:tRNA A37 methylthiotransferase MiaB
LEVVVEGGKGQERRGIARNYLAVRFAGGEAEVGRTVTVKIVAAENGELRGVLA